MSHLSLLATAPAHLDDAVITAPQALPSTAPTVLPPAAAVRSPSTVALSFAFDSVHKTLNVVVTDERSGEVLRKIEYNQIPHDVHRPDKLSGLLLNQFA
jgi:hypothetical protein